MEAATQAILLATTVLELIAAALALLPKARDRARKRKAASAEPVAFSDK